MQAETCRGLSVTGFHRLNYVEWGEADNPRVVFCVHGLTRNARDFDHLAARLARDYRVICPDVVGRGSSGWLADKSGYNYPQYLADMAVLIARSGAETIDLIGTSMGGLIGMLLAAQRNTPIARLVMNDVGPMIPATALRRIGQYVGKDMCFTDLESAERHIRAICAGFGPLSDTEWRHLTAHGTRMEGSGYVLSYDPAIRLAFEGIDADVELWPVWSMVKQPVLVLRGVESDLLTRETALRMQQREAPTTLIEFDGVGHAPMLMDVGQINAVADWLANTRPKGSPE